mgnify:CR=1 FL=1
MNQRIIYKEENGKLKPIVADWDKMPCKTCERRGTLACPKADCWNKDNKYGVY